MEKCVLLWLKTMLKFKIKIPHMYEKIFINVWYKFFILWLNIKMWRGRGVNTLSEFRGMYAGVLIHVLFPHTVTQYQNYEHPLVGDKRIYFPNGNFCEINQFKTQKYSCTKYVSESLLLPSISIQIKLQSYFFFYNTHNCCINVTYIFRYHKKY